MEQLHHHEWVIHEVSNGFSIVFKYICVFLFQSHGCFGEACLVVQCCLFTLLSITGFSTHGLGIPNHRWDWPMTPSSHGGQGWLIDPGVFLGQHLFHSIPPCVVSTNMVPIRGRGRIGHCAVALLWPGALSQADTYHGEPRLLLVGQRIVHGVQQKGLYRIDKTQELSPRSTFLTNNQPNNRENNTATNTDIDNSKCACHVHTFKS